jgi:hypothetical protein
MVPRAPDRCAGHKSSGKRCTIVRAGGSNSENLIARAHQENGLVTNSPSQHSAIGD